MAEWTKGRRDCLQPLPGWFLDRLHDYGRQNVATTLYEKHRSERFNVPTEPLFFVPQHTARSLNIDLKAAGIEKSTPEGKIDFHALRTTFSGSIAAPCALDAGPQTVREGSFRAPHEAVERVAAALGLTYFYAKTTPKPQKLAVGQDYNPLSYQVVRCGEEVVGAPGFEPGGLRLPKPTRYQATLRPVMSAGMVGGTEQTGKLSRNPQPRNGFFAGAGCPF